MSRGCVFYYFDMEISKLAFWNIILNWNQFHIASPGGVNIRVEVYCQSRQTLTLLTTENVHFATLSKTADPISRPWFISVRIQN